MILVLYRYKNNLLFLKPFFRGDKRFRDLGLALVLLFFHWSKSLLYVSGSGLRDLYIGSRLISRIQSVVYRLRNSCHCPYLYRCQTLTSTSAVCSHQVDSSKQIVPVHYNLQNKSAKL